MNNTLYDFDDILIEPTVTSSISSRKEINITRNGMLPLMTAPMDTVISHDNYPLFKNVGITPILPRGNTHIPFQENMFISYSLDEFIETFLIKKYKIDEPINILIDVANGHMEKLLSSADKAKRAYGDSMILMVGNVANPLTFLKFSNIGVDYVRIGIGNGNGCLTTVQTGVGYPMASLIKNCYDLRFERGHYNTKIVADGGFKKYSDIIKGLALGADYVMLGSILNKSLESAGETTNKYGDIVDQYLDVTKIMFKSDVEYFKTFRGMSTKEVQEKWGKESLTTSEGVVRTHKVEYTLEGWVSNFEDYLRSAMSYTGKKELHQFIGGVNINFITQNSFKRFDK